MSHEPFKEFIDKLIEDNRKPAWGSPKWRERMHEHARGAFTYQRVIDINALDPLDPVHVRSHHNTHLEQDHDGDLGREHQDYLRDNGQGSLPLSGGSGLAPFIQIGDALPVIESPSIVTEQPQHQETKAESDG